MCNNHAEARMPERFVNLHVHTSFSLLDSITRPEKLIEKVKRLGQPAVAVTEHGNIFSAVKVHKLAKKNDIKHIFGAEFYICDNRFEKDKNNKYYHLTILAKNEQGRLNINKLISKGYLEGFYFKPRIDFSLLEEHKDGLIVLSGCMASEIQQALAGGKIGDRDIEVTSGNIERAKAVVRRYRNVFGEDYYLEVQSHRDGRQQQLNRAIVDIGKELGIDWVVTADSHFVEEDDQELHSIFIQIARNKDDYELDEAYTDTQLQSEQEARKLLKPSLTDEEIDIAVRNTLIVTDKCNVKLPISAPLIPHVSVPKGFKDQADYLKHLCQKGWNYRGINKFDSDLRKQYRERLIYEYNAIVEMGFEGYYLLVESYANSVKRRGIARGSGGGSLVAYLLNIVDIDPIKYGLYFERFIDVGALDLLRDGVITPEELKIPDFDLDFGTEDRENVVKFIENTYSKEKFASLGQFGYIWDKSAIKDVGRVLNSMQNGEYKNKLDFNMLNQITKALDGLSIRDARDEGYLAKWERKFPKLFEYAENLAGLPRSFGLHPCGKVISIDDITHYHGILENDGHLVFQMDMDDAESLGLVKIDALGLRTVDVIYDVLEMIGKDYGYISPQNMNFNDNKVLDIFIKGYTDGIFQFESSGMKSTLKKMIPTCLDDLGAVNALYRPGSMRYIDNYIKRKHGEEKFEYLHSDLEPILNVTYGIIVYQEQLIEIGRLAGMRNPDKIRKATGKKIEKLMLECRDELHAGLINNRGWTENQFEQLWNDMLAFAKYSFNKSHSYAYAMIAYIGAFLKAYHPTEFMVALMNSYDKSSGQDKMDNFNTAYNEAIRLGVKIPNINFRNPSALCTISKNEIIYGISLIKYCNKNIAEDFKNIKDNEYNGFTELLIDLVEKTSADSRQIQILINLDFFSEFGQKEKLLEIYRQFKDGKGIKYDKKYAEKTKNQRIELLQQFEQEVMISDVEQISIYDQIMLEKECYGFIKTTYPKLSEDIYAIIDIDKTNTPKLHMHQFKTGMMTIMKVKKNKFYNDRGIEQLLIGDVVKLKNESEEGKWFTDGEGKWFQDDKIKERYLNSCKILQRIGEK
jgi:DNA polymerase-3 subunit alpha